MENHRSLQRTLLQAEIQKNSQKQPFTYSDSKQNGKELFDLLPSANMRNQKSNIHDTTCRFNTRTQKNLKEHLTVHSDSQNPDADRKKQPHKPDGEATEPKNITLINTSSQLYAHNDSEIFLPNQRGRETQGATAIFRIGSERRWHSALQYSDRFKHRASWL
jgi:hypothetical protein